MAVPDLRMIVSLSRVLRGLLLFACGAALLFAGSGCAYMSADPESYVAAAVESLEKSPASWQGRMRVLVDGQAVYQEEGAPRIIIPVDEWLRAITSMETDHRRSNAQYAVIRAQMRPQAARNAVVRYLQIQLEAIRSRHDARAKLEAEEERLKQTLDTLTAEAEYLLWIDRKTKRMHKLDARTVLHYNKEGSTMKEVIEGSFLEQANAEHPSQSAGGT